MSFSISSSKALSLCIAACVAIGAALICASEAMLRQHIAPQDEFIAHTKLFNTQRVADAAFGDSHVARGFVPPEGMLNLAYPSEPIPRMAWKIQTYYADHAPGRIILQADPHIFAPYRLNKSLGDYPQQFENPVQAKFGLLVSIPRYRANLVNYWASFVRKDGQLKSEITFTESGAHLSPGDISKEPQRFRTFAAKRRAAIHVPGPIHVQNHYRDMYSEILTTLESKGANICMVTFPVSPEYRNAASAVNATARARIFEFFKSEAQRVGATYVNWEQATDQLSDFRDTDHLNGDAAKRLSPQLMNRCFPNAIGP